MVFNGANASTKYVMLHAPPRIANIPNVMGKGYALDSSGMVGFGVFWVLTCFFLVIPVPSVLASPLHAIGILTEI